MCVCVPERSYAECSMCSKWKLGTAEDWKQHEIENSRRGKSCLICKACKQKGCTKRSHGMQECVACKQTLGRTFFNGEDLKKQKKKEKAHASYTLVCIACKERERQILQTIDELKGKPCRRCYTSTWRHMLNCPAMKVTKLRLSRNDLEWLKFRARHRSSPFLTDLKYYEDIGVLVP